MHNAGDAVAQWNGPHRWEHISQISTATAFGTEENTVIKIVSPYTHILGLTNMLNSSSF
jgi:hypothetical protein